MTDDEVKPALVAARGASIRCAYSRLHGEPGHVADDRRVKSLDYVGLQRRLANDGMVLPNGRALNVSAAAWENLLDRLAQKQWATTWPDSEGIRPRDKADLSKPAFALARVQVTATVRVNIFPSWGTDAVWFDFDAREMREQDDADALSDFIREVGQTVGRTVELSYEGRDGDVFAAYVPDLDDFRWTDVL